VADLRGQLASGLAASYTIVRELGRGGMATVFLAQDLRHERPVALKVLRSELAATLGPERFQREIKLAARLQHPHILTVHDSGEAAGQLWYAMPYVEGESLRDRLRREPQLPIDEALLIAKETAQALDHAHRHGVVHRDIKPENILLTREGDVLVADFGIARAVGAESGLTETGLAVGTPAYMSPEQAAGEREVDARADIYALGCVVYEMLAGEPPFTGPTAQVITARRMSEPARPLRKTRETVPESVERAVAKALARVPADRYATAADFARALAREATAVSETPSRWRPSRNVATLSTGFLLGLGLLFAWLTTRSPHVPDAGSGTATIRLAVLPFENLSDSADVYFADGVTDAVRGKLASLPRLQVTASTSSNRYRATSKTPQKIARELEVDYLLVGRIRSPGGAAGAGRVQVSPELIRASTGSTAWQEPFDATLADVFQVQADVATRVAGVLGIVLDAGERRTLSSRPTENLAAYDAFLRGERDRPEWGSDAVRRAIASYTEAVRLDTGFAVGWARLAEVTAKGGQLGMPGLGDAEAAARRAVRLAPDRGDGYRALGLVVQGRLTDAPEALRLFRRAQDLSPNDPEILGALGELEVAMGLADSGMTHLGRARELDPLSVAVAQAMANGLHNQRRLDEADAEVDRGLALQPGSPTLLIRKVMIALSRGDSARARAIAASLDSGTAATTSLALYWMYPWVLDEQRQQVYMRLPIGPFGGNDTWHANAQAIVSRFRGDSARMRVWADSGLRAGEDWWRETEPSPFRNTIHGMLLAMAGRSSEADAEARQAARVVDSGESEEHQAYVLHLAAWTETMAGRHDAAIGMLEQTLRRPYELTRAQLAIDPAWESLRALPRFQQLLRAGAP
jgi:serine/threonine protein kinase/tetratricopeptide (TPR) repeat protein